MYREKKLGVVIPAYNVERHIKAIIEGLPAMIDRVYVVDDGSTDNTSSVIKDCSNVCLVRHQVNKGPGAATITGFLSALRDNMDVIIKLDGDGQMRPEQIESLILPIVEGKVDYTKGDRLSNKSFCKSMPKFRLAGNHILTYLTRIASGYWRINDTQNGFIAISRRALQSIGIETLYPYYGYLNDILVRLNVNGFAIQDIPMAAKYGHEKSSVKLARFIPKVSLLLIKRFLWRIKHKYLKNRRPLPNYYQVPASKCELGSKHLKILVKIGHPAHVHFLKNFILKMRKNGHDLLICAIDKDVAIELLEAHGFEYVRTGKSGDNPVSKVLNLMISEYNLWRVARSFNPDIMTGPVAIDVAHVSRLLHKPSIIFDDTAHARVQQFLYVPFASVVCTPACFRKDFGQRHIRYNGCKEIAYLHPDYFIPDPSVLSELGFTQNEKYVILRFVAWRAIHDIGQHGLELSTKYRLVKELGRYARVLITSEADLPADLEQYRVKVKASKMLDLMYYATLYVGEGATMASECAVMGTPAIYFNPLKLDYLEQHEKNYGLVINYTDTESSQELVVEKALELVKSDNIKEEWRAKSRRFLADQVDVTRFLVDFIENYPMSLYQYQEKMEDNSVRMVHQNRKVIEAHRDAAEKIAAGLQNSSK